MKIRTEYEFEAKDISEMISGAINNIGQLYELYNHVNSAPTNKTDKTNKSFLCEYYIDTETHKAYRLEDLILKLVKENKIQPDISR